MHLDGEELAQTLRAFQTRVKIGPMERLGSIKGVGSLSL